MRDLLERLRLPRHLGKNLVIVAALVAAGFLVAWLRFRPWLGSEGRYTDGVRSYEVTTPGSVRYAVWDRPVPFPGELNGPEAEGRATRSADGRWMVFAVGERGLGADLWIAELVDGEARDARPLAALNTGADELAPAFAGGWLWFASDRAGTVGGLDLWRAPFDGELFGEPERVGGGLNSSADDTDPAPVPGSAAVVFASDRDSRPGLTDFDLHLARPLAGQAGYEVLPLTELNTGHQEREPALTADGLALFLASDRPGGAGGFDLYRSAVGLAGEGARRWLAPEPLEGLNGPGDERAPAPSPDGFTLVYSAAPPGDVPDLLSARSLELFRMPGRPVGWRELLFLLALFAIALLAWLAKRWEQLEVVYKCFLVSALVHLFLLLYLREVYPESPETLLRGGEERIRVRLVADAARAAAGAERGGRLEVQRPGAERAAEEPRRASLTHAAGTSRPRPVAGDLEAAPRRGPGAPARGALADLERARETAGEMPAVRVPREAFEPSRAGAPELELVAAAPASAAAAVRTDGRSSLARHVEEDRGEPAPGPRSLELAPSAPPAVPRALAGRRAPDPALDARPREATAVADLELAAPASPAPAPATGAGEVASLALEPLDLGAGPSPGERTAGAPERARVGARGEERPDLAGGPLLLTPSRSSAPIGGPVGPRVAVELERGSAHELAVDLVPPPALAEAPGQATASVGGRTDGAAEPALTLAPTPTSPRSEAPARLALDAARFERPRTDATAPAPAAFAIALPDPSASARGPVTSAPIREPLPEPRRAAALGELLPELRAPVVETGTRDRSAEVREASAPSAPDLLAGLPAVADTGALARPGRELPRRFESRPVEDVPEPVLEPLRLAREERAPAGRRERWDHTPYQARSGARKLEALALFGGSAETERAVALGLEYLASIQARDGYWGSARDRHEKYGQVAIGKTGLCLLAFLGAGHTAGSGSDHAAVVEGALDFLLAVQDERSGHFGDSSAYGHGIATYALAEAYALTREERLRAPLERAVAQVLRHQVLEGDERFRGGWSYYYPDGRTFDRWPRASITAWQVMALESARLGGLEVPDAAFEGARAFLEGAWDGRRGAFRYSHDPSRLRSEYAVLPGSTPASLFALSLLGEDVEEERWREARAFVRERAPREYRWEGSDAFVHRARGNLYFWYYGTLALFRVGGEEWREWNVALQEALLPAQGEDGSFEPISIYARDYAGDDDGDRSYSTAMCVLSLEVYYRYFTPLLRVDAR